MLQTETFETILQLPESSTLDFKNELYDFGNKKEINTAKFIKDVLSFSNTIRKETSYIIFGISETPNKEAKLVGIPTSIDDAIFQDKVKDKVFPRPIFSYYTVRYQEMTFGILEFPIVKYELPITPTVKLRGLDVGKVYYRNGTSNTEATGIDVIRINDWFKSLPGNVDFSLTDEISKLLKRLTTNHEKLSSIVTDIHNLARKNNLTELEEFSAAQIQGMKSNESEKYKYRIGKVIISINEVSVNPNPFLKVSADMVKKEMQDDKDFHDYKLFFNHSIVKIEEILEKFHESKNTTYATLKMSSKHIFGKGDYMMNIYIFEDTLEYLYSNLRQRTIDELMKI